MQELVVESLVVSLTMVMLDVTITAGGKLDAPVAQRAFWCIFEGLVAIALLLGGEGSGGRERLNREVIPEAIRPCNPQGACGVRHWHTGSTYARHRIRHGIRHTTARTRRRPCLPVANERLRHMLIGYARVSKADRSQPRIVILAHSGAA